MSGEKPKPTIEEALQRLRSLVVVVMVFPIFGMIAASVLIYMQQPPYLGLILGAILFITAVYALVVFFFVRSVDAMVRNARKKEATA